MSYIFLSWLICVWMLSKKNFEMLYENVENQMLKINIFDLGIIFCSLTFKRKACFLENSKFVLRSFMCPTFLMMSGTYPKIFQGWDIPPPHFFRDGPYPQLFGGWNVPPNFFKNGTYSPNFLGMGHAPNFFRDGTYSQTFSGMGRIPLFQGWAIPHLFLRMGLTPNGYGTFIYSFKWIEK